MADLHELTALEQAAAIRRRELSPVELVEHYLERIERLNPAVGAFVTVTSDRARAAAGDAEAAVLAGGDLPPLHGVPTAIKDLNLTAGVPTRLGSAAFGDGIDLGVDDNVVVRLRAAGSISLGKTNTPELGLPCYTESDIAPPARTPWDLARSAGGSSGGAAAADAAGLVPVAQGNDGGGSVRIPASMCGLVGVKPARGRVSNGPFLGEGPGLVVQGPLARTVRDAAAMLDAMAGPMPDDMTWAPPLPPGETFLAACSRPPARLRVGRYRRPVVADVDLHPECRAAWEEASSLLEKLGHEVVDIDRPFNDSHVPFFELVWATGPASYPFDDAQLPALRPLTRWLRDRGRAASAADYGRALSTLQLAARWALAVTAAYDVVLTPTLAEPPVPVGAMADGDNPAADFEAQKRFTPFTMPYNMTGQPAVTLPLHWTPDGLPVGVQLVGRPFGEAPLLSLAAQLEAARPWSERRPPLW